MTANQSIAKFDSEDYHDLVFASRKLKLAKYSGSEKAARQINTNAYEPPLPIVLMGMVARAKGIFVDVGGNNGVYTILAGLTRKDVAIHTFEPFPDAIKLIHRNIELNGIANQVQVHPIALSDTNGHSTLYLPDPKHGLLESSASLEVTFKAHTSTLNVETRTLDEIDLGGSVAVIKIDVEGHEHAVIRGAKRRLLADRPVVFAEMLSGAKPHFFEVSKIFNDSGYVIFRLWQHCAIETPVIFADRHSWNYALIPVEQLNIFRTVCGSHGLEVLKAY